MEKLTAILNRPLLHIGDEPITLVQLFSVPLAILLILVLAGWIARVVSGRMRAKGADANLIQVINRAFWVVVIFVLFLTILGMLNVPLAAFAFLSGAVAIGVGFGAQNIINNFISGWIIMGERPIRVDDLIEIDGTLGRVEAINTRSTRIRRVDGVRIVVPNSHMLENKIVNWTLVDSEVRGGEFLASASRGELIKAMVKGIYDSLGGLLRLLPKRRQLMKNKRLSANDFSKLLRRYRITFRELLDHA